MKDFFKKIKGKKGSAMLEVIISMFVISFGLTGAIGLIITAINLNSVNKDRILAVNIAREGIEAVRSMRDTNWLVWSAIKRECWNYWDNTDNNAVIDIDTDDPCREKGDTGQNENPFPGGDDKNLIVNFDEKNHRWLLIDLDNNPPENYTEDLYVKNGLYNHNPLDADYKSKFQRKIYFKYIDSDDGSFPANEKSRDNRIKVKSTVEWVSNGNKKSITLASTLTDYYKRENWSD